MNAFTRFARKIGISVEDAEKRLASQFQIAQPHSGGNGHRGWPGNPARYNSSRRWHVIRRQGTK